MQIVILLFDRFAAIDAVAFHDALSTTPDAGITFAAVHPGAWRDETSQLEVTADAALREVPRPQVVVLPGGAGARNAAKQRAVRTWLAAAAASAWTVTVADGALIAGYAGLLAGHTVAAPQRLHSDLAALHAAPVHQPIAVSGRVASAVSADGAPKLSSLLLTHAVTTKGHCR